MTARTDYTVSYDREKMRSGDPMLVDEAVYEVVKSIEDINERFSEQINGSTRSDYFGTSEKWSPILKDTANSGTTFTYAHQRGYVIRKGLVVDLWFDVQWTGNTGAITGNMYVELPYVVALTNSMPFVGVLQASGIAFTGGSYLVLNAINNTRRGEVWYVGSAIATGNQASSATGRLIGNIRYVGKQNEW
jgi:hypothetical protein